MIVDAFDYLADIGQVINQASKPDFFYFNSWKEQYFDERRELFQRYLRIKKTITNLVVTFFYEKLVMIGKLTW